MRRPRRDVLLVGGLLAVLAVVTALAATRQTQQSTPPPLASFSNAPDGTRALRLWLGQLGYTVRDDTLDPFELPPDTSLAFMLEPTTAVTPEEWRTLDKWVEAGGTLVLAGDGLGTDFATGHYTVTLAYLTETVPSLAPQAPLFASPPMAQPASVQSQAYFVTTRPDVIPLLSADDRLVALAFSQGKGRVILSAAPYAFTNAGLKLTGNPELALNLVSASGASAASPPARGAVWFDEWHHGVRPNAAAAISGPEDWLRFTPAGHALLFVAALIFLALLLRGRRFGRPVPMPHETVRRAPLEYITAMANLHRRAGQRRHVLRHYHDQLKRRLGHRYRLDPALHDGEYVARLAGLRPSLDAQALRALLKALSQPAVTEADLVRLAGQTADLMKETT